MFIIWIQNMLQLISFLIQDKLILLPSRQTMIQFNSTRRKITLRLINQLITKFHHRCFIRMPVIISKHIWMMSQIIILICLIQTYFTGKIRCHRTKFFVLLGSVARFGFGVIRIKKCHVSGTLLHRRFLFVNWKYIRFHTQNVRHFTRSIFMRLWKPISLVAKTLNPITEQKRRRPSIDIWQVHLFNVFDFFFEFSSFVSADVQLFEILIIKIILSASSFRELRRTSTTSLSILLRTADLLILWNVLLRSVLLLSRIILIFRWHQLHIPW